MRMIGNEGEEFRLDVLGYQFPEIKDNEWDSEWLIISGEAMCAQGRWTFRDPCLCTFEVQTLAAWLRDVRIGGPKREIGFTEPNLRFEHIERRDGDILSVAFSQECSPPWATEDQRYGEGFELSFPFQLNDFTAAATALESMLLRWPVRTRKTEAG
jgi:hypothetical protein